MLKAHNIYYNSFRIETYVHKFHAGAKQGLGFLVFFSHTVEIQVMDHIDRNFVTRNTQKSQSQIPRCSMFIHQTILINFNSINIRPKYGTLIQVSMTAIKVGRRNGGRYTWTILDVQSSFVWVVSEYPCLYIQLNIGVYYICTYSIHPYIHTHTYIYIHTYRIMHLLSPENSETLYEFRSVGHFIDFSVSWHFHGSLENKSTNIYDISRFA